MPEEAHPKAEGYGAGSKITRYYWRELFTETLSRFDLWARSQGIDGWMIASRDHEAARKRIEREVLAEIKALHEATPKYDFKEDSQDDVIRRFGVEVVALKGVHARHDERLCIVDGDDHFSPEEFVARHYRRAGFQVMFVESVPFHVLFATLMWMVIQDPEDPLLQFQGFGGREAYERREKGQMIWTSLPQDFGSSEYGVRRHDAIEKHFASLPSDKDQLLGTFDYWIGPSSDLRQYLWAHSSGDMERARNVLRTLPAQVTFTILRVLIDDYWGRYLGWPDLLCYDDRGFFFVEVKSSKDKLSQQQKEWIALNVAHLRLPFRIVKIHNVKEHSED